MSRHTLTNRRNQNVVAIIDEPHSTCTGTAVVVHGFSGTKDQPHIKAMSDALCARGYRSIRFDATHSLGESDGDLFDASLTRHSHDLEDVMAWAESQPWFQPPVVMAGHSLGGAAILLFTASQPEKVKAIAPISTVVSGKLTYQSHTRKDPAEMPKWQQQGFKIKQSSTGKKNKVSWAYMENLLTYNLLQQAPAITCPVLMAVADQDTSTPPDHQQILADKLAQVSGPHIIKAADHTFRSPQELADLTNIMDNWLNGLSD